jgi:hypothetical protein
VSEPKLDWEVLGILRAWSEHKPEKNPQAHHGYEDEMWCLDDECGVDWPCVRWRTAQAYIAECEKSANLGRIATHEGVKRLNAEARIARAEAVPALRHADIRKRSATARFEIRGANEMRKEIRAALKPKESE